MRIFSKFVTKNLVSYTLHKEVKLFWLPLRRFWFYWSSLLQSGTGSEESGFELRLVSSCENYLSYSQPIVHEWSFPFSRSRLTSVKPSFHLSTSFLPSSPPSSSSSLSLSLYLLFLLFLLPFLLLRLLSYILTVSLGPLYYSIPLTLSLFSKFLYVLLSFNFSLTLLLSLPLTLPLCPPKNIRTSHHGMALMESMDCASRLRLKLGSFDRAMKYQPHFEASSLLES